MGQKTKIDWAEASWNPATGCLHGCEYCYARRIAERFSGHFTEYVSEGGLPLKEEPEKIHVLDDHFEMRSGAKINGVFTTFSTEGKKYPYPFGFDPTFHRYRLGEPQKWKKPRNIFVCSMADLFGNWVPNDWIRAVFDACRAAPWHRYIFLTKNPERYVRLGAAHRLPMEDNFWYGTSVTHPKNPAFFTKGKDQDGRGYHTFCSIEPILERFGKPQDGDSLVTLTDWVIIGAETGNRKDKVVPEKDWILELAEEFGKNGKPVFMKESLREIMGNDFRQEFPWEIRQP